MKKLFKTMMLALSAALVIASCENVPGPYDEPEVPNPEVPTGGGTWDSPYSVSDAIANQTGEEVWVHAYIVGSIPEDASSTVLSNMTFTAEGAHYTNMCVADNPEETDYSKCVPVQLPSGSDARTNLNLKENPAMLGKEVWLKGKTIKYCGAPGLKEVSKYTLTKPTEADDETPSDEPAEGAMGDGSLENPFNAAAAHNYTSALPSGETTAEKFYIKGIVCQSNKMDISTQYKNATFHISSDGTANGTMFLIFRTKGLNGADITSVDDIQVGDEVVVYASLVNYMGNTPETAQGGIIYSQKRNGQELEGGGETPDSPSTNPIGDGSLENPYNVSAVMALYANGNAEGQSVHVKGKISKVKSLDVSKWERAQYYISDDGTENGQFQIYNGYYLGGKPFTSNDQIKVGDEVIVYGELSSYNGTPQIAQNSKIVSINGQTAEEETPGDNEGEGDQDTPTEGNILKNGDFELWDGNVPTNWKSASTAGNVSITQSTEAHGGTYAASMGFVKSSNKRMAYKETILPAGTYKFTFYAKGTDTSADSKCQTRPGYATILADGSADSQGYKYGEYINLSATEWTLVEHEFTLEAETRLCLVIMSPKNSNYHTSQNILVDDASLIKIN